MYKEKCEKGSISRVIFSPIYTVRVVLYLYRILICLPNLIILTFYAG